MSQYQTIIEYCPDQEAQRAAQKRRAQAGDLLLEAIEFESQARFISEIRCKLPPSTFFYCTPYGSPELRVTIPVAGFLCDAAPELAEFLEWLSQYYEEPPRSLDVPNAGRRVYIFEPASSPGLRVEVAADLIEGSEACQRVMTGTRQSTKLVEVEITEPVFAFKC